jgi:hypothetical protein
MFTLWTPRDLNKISSGQLELDDFFMITDDDKKETKRVSIRELIKFIHENQSVEPLDELYKWAKKRAKEEEKSANTWPDHSEQRSYRSGASNTFLEVWEKIETIKNDNR